MAAKHTILGVHVFDRVQQVPTVQQVFTEYGCYIKTRLGLHEASDGVCSANGLIVLELVGDAAKHKEMVKKLGAMKGIEVKEMVFEGKRERQTSDFSPQSSGAEKETEETEETASPSSAGGFKRKSNNSRADSGATGAPSPYPLPSRERGEEEEEEEETKTRARPWVAPTTAETAIEGDGEMRVPLSKPAPDFGRLRKSLMLEGAPDRLVAAELFCDQEIMQAVLGKTKETWQATDYIEFQWRMGYDYLNAIVSVPDNAFVWHAIDEENPDSLATQRGFIDEQTGPIQNWADFEKFQWPTATATDFSQFDLYAKHLPKGMKLIAWICGFFENVSWSVGIQPFCFMLMDDRPLAAKLFEKWGEYCIEVSRVAMDQPEVGAYWISDDLGFNSGPFMSPADCREFVMPVYAELGRMCKARNLPFILHSCGRLHSIMDDLIGCGVNCLHSLPPNLYDLMEIKKRWGDKLCFAGNVDLNILGRGTAEETRQAVRGVKAAWAAERRGGVVLSTANTVANYCQVENYLAMMDERQA